MEFAVLVLGNCGGCPLSARLVFDEDRILKNLDCGHTFAEAAQFLVNHSNTLILSDERACQCTWSNLLPRLIVEGRPAALLTMKEVSSEVKFYHDPEILRYFFIDGDVLRAIAAVWEYCKDVSRERPSLGRIPMPPRVM